MKTTSKQTVDLAHDVSLPETLEASRLLHSDQFTKSGLDDLFSLKNTRYDENKSLTKLFFFVGLTLSLLFVTVMMNWKTYDRAELVDLGSLNAEFEDMLEVPVSVQPPPPPPPAQNQMLTIVEVEDDVLIEEVEISLDVEMIEETQIADHNIDFTMEPEEEVVEEVFTVVENWPEPTGGMSAFYSFVGENIVYPSMARRLNVQGIVFCQFVVEKNGVITDVKVVRGIGAGCDEEAVKVLRSAPAWEPGKQRGRPVRVLMTVPIRFVLNTTD